MNRRPVIIDTDPGIDDAMAIMMMQASGRFDIRGITAVHGNVSLEHTSGNALFLSELYAIDCPVALGAKNALIVSLAKAESIHGRNGLGGFVYLKPEKKFHNKYAWDLIYDAALECEGELELFAIGPLTNIAIAVLKYPGLKELIKNIVIMAGAAHSGNVSPYAEFNVWQDPHAASIVLDFGFRKLTMVDLDCCCSGYLTDNEADKLLLLKSDIGPLFESIRFYQRKLQRELDSRYAGSAEFQPNRCIYCDAVAAAVMIEPEITVTRPYHVFIETQSVLNFGQTVVDWNGRFNQRPNAALAGNVDRDRFTKLFFDSLDYYDGERTVRFDG